MAIDPVCGMSVDEKSGLRVTKEGREYYFCSRGCMEKFLKENNMEGETCVSCIADNSGKWYRNKTLMVSTVLVMLTAASYSVSFLSSFRESLFMYLSRIWWAVILGLLLGGVIDYYIPREYISHVLSKPKKRTIFYSVVLGFLMSACSHGILALSIQLYKKGASVPAVVAFLLAAPWANFPLTIMLLGFFGLKALYIIFSAILIAVITGLAYQYLESRGKIETNPNTESTDDAFSLSGDIRSRMKNSRMSAAGLRKGISGVIKGSVSLSNMVLWWILIGVGLASLAAAYIPQPVFQHYIGPSFLGLMVTLALATVLEVCSEGTAPLAFEIYRQTGALGNVFVFLMAGVVTDYTEIGLIWSNIGRRAAIYLPLITVPQVVLLGVLANIIF
ncbi:MAG: permease [Elusimicrobia bacterium]|nr:permease [Elusimicrobiota bacterium]